MKNDGIRSKERTLTHVYMLDPMVYCLFHLRSKTIFVRLVSIAAEGSGQRDWLRAYRNVPKVIDQQ